MKGHTHTHKHELKRPVMPSIHLLWLERTFLTIQLTVWGTLHLEN